MPGLSDLEKDYIGNSTPCDCQCAFHKYGKTEEELVHAAKEEAKRIQEAKKQALIDAEDEKRGVSIFKRRANEPIPADPRPRFSYHASQDLEGPVRYGGVKELEAECLSGYDQSEQYKREHQRCIDGYHTVVSSKKSGRR